MEKTKVEYDPRKKYNWTPETEFVLKGGEFGLLLNATRTILSTPEAQRILLTERVNDILEQIMQQAVESGKAFEAPSPKSDPQMSVTKE